MRVSIILIGLGLVLGLPTSGQAVDPDVKCNADKVRETAKYYACRLKAESKAIKKGEAPDYTKCDSKYSAKWQKAESKAAGACPTESDEAAIQARMTDDADDIVTLLGGGTPASCGDGVKNLTEDCDDLDLGGLTCEAVGFESGTLTCSPGCGLDVSGCVSTCGNGTIEGSEECDFGDLDGATCPDEGFLFGTLACGAGCLFDPNGCTNTRFVDPNDGTIIDNQTGLVWEKKTDDGSIHDLDDFYHWSATSTAPDGPAFTVFLGTLNNGTSGPGTTSEGCFADHCDWRLPTIVELATILLEPNPCGTNPCIDPIFGPTVSSSYWASTSLDTDPNFAWMIIFNSGPVSFIDKNTAVVFVRAVRGGL